MNGFGAGDFSQQHLQTLMPWMQAQQAQFHPQGLPSMMPQMNAPQMNMPQFQMPQMQQLGQMQQLPMNGFAPFQMPQMQHGMPGQNLAAFGQVAQQPMQPGSNYLQAILGAMQNMQQQQQAGQVRIPDPSQWKQGLGTNGPATAAPQQAPLSSLGQIQGAAVDSSKSNPGDVQWTPAGPIYSVPPEFLQNMYGFGSPPQVKPPPMFMPAEQPATVGGVSTTPASAQAGQGFNFNPEYVAFMQAQQAANQAQQWQQETGGGEGGGEGGEGEGG